jgi:hypothetical protein
MKVTGAPGIHHRAAFSQIFFKKKKASGGGSGATSRVEDFDRRDNNAYIYSADIGQALGK